MQLLEAIVAVDHTGSRVIHKEEDIEMEYSNTSTSPFTEWIPVL
jgi:hypothetical protein